MDNLLFRRFHNPSGITQKHLAAELLAFKVAPVNPSEFHGTSGLTLQWLLITMVTSVHAASGPVAFWRGEGNAVDSIGTNNGVLLNGVSFVAGIVPGETGQAFSLDGLNDEMRFGNSPDFNFTNGVTIAGWLKTSGTPDFSGLVDKFEQVGQVTGIQVGFSGNNGFPPNQSGILRSDIGTGNTYNTAYNFRPVIDGLPHHFAVTCDAEQLILYVDGMAGTPVAETNWVPNNTDDIVVGHDSDSGGRHFNGQLDELVIYARALSAAEVQALAGKPVLQIVRSAPGEATVSWPQTVSGFRLQTNNTLNPGGWGNAASGTNNPVAIPTSSSPGFYRLVKP